MSTLEFGAFMLLLGAAWQEDPPATLPNDDQILARLARLELSEWHECRSVVISPFKLHDDGRWHQKRLRQVYAEVVQNMRTGTEKARNAANARWGKVKKPEPGKSACNQAEMIAYGERMGYPKDCSTWVWDSLEANGWMWGQNPVNDWQAVYRIKAKDWRARVHREAGQNGRRSPMLEALQAKLAVHPGNPTWRGYDERLVTPDQKADYRKLKAELEKEKLNGH